MDESNTKKSISFKGKHNIDKMNNLEHKTQAKRLHIDLLCDQDLTHINQIDMLNKLYMDCDFPLKSLLEKELASKISGYKAQDNKKELSSETDLITLGDTLEKLVATKLRCHYCKCEIVLLYKNVREPTQWTLDRIDNSKGHTKNNTIIACLKCNLQRRVTHIDKFTFTKKLVLKKV
jgi:hypothetical protein